MAAQLGSALLNGLRSVAVATIKRGQRQAAAGGGVR